MDLLHGLGYGSFRGEDIYAKKNRYEGFLKVYFSKEDLLLWVDVQLVFNRIGSVFETFWLMEALLLKEKVGGYFVIPKKL